MADQKLARHTLFGLLKPYRARVTALVVFALSANVLGLALPLLTARAIDAYQAGTLDLSRTVWQFAGVSLAIFVFAYLQSVAQTYASEVVARDLRAELSAKISRRSYAAVQAADPSKLLTNLTADADSVKSFVSQAIVSLISSGVIIIGASALLLSIDWHLGLAVLAVLPVIAVTFFVTFAKVRKLFLQSREILDRLNRVINESILGAALIRVLNARRAEQGKFEKANGDARDVGFRILSLFAAMIPIITFASGLATLLILVIGGRFVIGGTLSLGDFAAFNAYLAMLIFPIFVIGFMGNVIAQAGASYGRIRQTLDAPEEAPAGSDASVLRGEVEARAVSMRYGEKAALTDVSFFVPAGGRLAILGPTGAGKTQLIYSLAGLLTPQSGEVLYDGKPVAAYEPRALRSQIGVVFQESIVFNTTLRENVAFAGEVTDAAFARAVQTAELEDFAATLPKGFDTLASERGTTLSGGQKQRLMLARALALSPKVLLLDDFTARVDAATEQRILRNVARNYPGMTIISVTQKVSSAEGHDRVILLMDGEVLAQGTHAELLASSPEYVQISESQRSTNRYELHA